ncbi:ATP-binding cassette domain-containing protein [Streptococcus dentiloxodontae]
MLQVHCLTIIHQKDLQTLVKDLSLVVNSGKKLAIIGEEGTGKSTLLKAILNPELIGSYTDMTGTIQNSFSRIGYLPQNIEEKDLALTIKDYIYHDIDYDLFDFNRFYQMAERFQFDSQRFDDDSQTISSLSGGEKLKLQLLKMLAYEPDLLLFDEPSSDLDLETTIWLEKFIRQTDKTIIFISHDETLLENTATAILQLELGKKRQEPRASYFQGNYQDYKQRRKKKFAKQSQLAQKEREEHAKKMARHHRIHQSVENQLRNTKNDVLGRLLAKKMKNVLSQEKRYAKEAENFTEIPQDMDAIKIFFSDIRPLPVSKILLCWENRPLPTGQVIDLEIRGQDKLAITGQNGIGKTRLLKEVLAALMDKPDLSVGYMPQNYEELLDDKQSALQFLKKNADEESCRNLLASLQFTRDEIMHSVTSLSGGQKAKLFLAKIVLEGSNVLLLDEPTRHFSPTSQPLIRQVFKDFPGCIISVSHDRKFIDEVAREQYYLTQTELVKLN